VETSVLFLCIGFLSAVLYIDVTFDRTVPPPGNDRGKQQTEGLQTITTYYRHITRNPYPLMAVMAAAIGSTIVQIVQGHLSRGVAWGSLFLIGACALVAVLKVIPAAQNLATGGGEARGRVRTARAVLSYHLMLLTALILLIILQILGGLDLI
jgi:hypothetical protein